MPTMFKVLCTSRSRETRATRRLNPVHGGCVQFIGGTHRIVRGRAILFSEQQIEQHLAELRDREARGLICVTTIDGRPVSIQEGTFLQAPAMPPTPPKPNPPLDSISRDDPWFGQPMESLPGSLPLGATEEFKLPAAIGVVLDEPKAEAPADPVVEQVAAPVEALAEPSVNQGGKKKKRN